jgi:hypothetical protein
MKHERAETSVYESQYVPITVAHSMEIRWLNLRHPFPPEVFGPHAHVFNDVGPPTILPSESGTDTCPHGAVHNEFAEFPCHGPICPPSLCLKVKLAPRRAGLDAVENSLVPTGNRSSTVQPVARRYAGSILVRRQVNLFIFLLHELFSCM